MYNVSELSSILEISKQAVYKKINQFSTELKECIFKENGKIKINEKGLNFLKLNTAKESNYTEFKQVESNLTTIKLVEENLNKLVESLNNQVEFLRQELETKNNQLEKKDQLLENMQVLLKQNQLLLESKNESFLQRVFKKFHIQ